MTVIYRIFTACLILFGAAAHAETSNRIVVLGPVLAEIVVALDAGDQIVGRGGGTDHLPGMQDVPRIPGYRLTSAENLLSLAPTLVLLAERQSSPQLVSQLQNAGVTVEVVGYDGQLDVETPVRQIARLGKLLDREAKAKKVIEVYRKDLAAALALAGKASTKPRALFILSGGGRPTLVAGGDTHIALLIELAGGQNMTDGISQFKPISQEIMFAAAPEFILVNEAGLELKDGAPVALAAPGARLTPAARKGNVITLPTGMLSDLGPSTPRAIEALARKFHPELADE